MGQICPECRAGKHKNCNGVGDIANDDTPIVCHCIEDGHTADRNITVLKLSGFIGIPQPVPEDDPSFRADAFPEFLEGDEAWDYNYRMRPDATVIHDLFDVEIMNPQGVWVPAVAFPLHVFFGIHQCLCGKYRLGQKRYQEHYAYAHILGMEET